MSDALKPVAWLFVCEKGPYAGEIDVHSLDGNGGSEETRVVNFYSEPFPVVRLSEAASHIEAQASRIKELESFVEDGVALLEVIKEDWIDYDHIYSIHVSEAKSALSKATLSQKEENE